MAHLVGGLTSVEGTIMAKKLLISTIDKLADFAVAFWIERCTMALQRKKYFSVALSGGSTPVPFYRKLSGIADPALWRNTHIFPVDERFVPSGHPDNNFRMIQETLTGKVPIPASNLHPVIITGTPEDSALLYETEIKRFFNLPDGTMPRFNLVLLGIGAEGHTASIFPGSRIIREKSRPVAVESLDEKRHPRVTLTLPALNNAEQILFLATGQAKAGALKKILEENDAHLPASLVDSGTGSAIYLLDPGAASGLSQETAAKYGF